MNRQRAAQRAQVEVKLGRAAGISRRDCVSAGTQQVACLACAEVGGRLRVEQVVDARGAAANLGFGANLQQLYAGDRPQQLAWLIANALSVGEMAGVVIGHAALKPVPRRPRRDRGQHLGDILDPRGEGAGFLGAKELPVLLHRRAAAGGVYDHVVEWRQLGEGPDSGRRARYRLRLGAAVKLERAAALGRLRCKYFETLGGEHPDRGQMHLRVENPLHASQEQAYPAALFAPRRGMCRYPGARPAQRRSRRQFKHRPQALGEASGGQ